ncbi:hypothetical protein C8Q72DRAFT_792040 [Fomitopsis betulina]|nr:hypothetical protein C8Q72DRAFT_792040 [Fomitopsis betulina]
MATPAEVILVYDKIAHNDQHRYLHTFTYFEDYMLFSAIALIVYDYILTFDREVRFVWASRQSLGTFLFYGFRYPAVFNIVLVLLARLTFPSWQSSWIPCVIAFPEMALDIIVLVSATVFAASRIYAIYNRNWILFSLVLVFGLVNPAISIYIFTKTLAALIGVSTYMSEIQPTQSVMPVATQSCSLTIIGAHSSYQKTFRKVEASAAGVGRVSVLKQVLLRDTVVCFGLLCVVNVIGMATGHLDQWIEVTQNWVAVYVFELCIYGWTFH